MGGFGTALAGALQGVSGAMVQEHKEHLEQDLLNRQAAQAMWQHIIDNPDAPADVKQHALASFMGIATTPPGKNWSKFTKPYERPQQQPSQQQPPMVMQPPPLAPTQAASPGPQAPESAGGGASPGVLQGQANQLPPLQPMAPPPPPAPNPMTMPPTGGPTVIPGAVTPAVTGPSIPAPLSVPGHAAAQALQTQMQAKYDALINMGVPPEQARMAVAGLAPMMMPKPATVLLHDGSTIAALRRLGADGAYHYYSTDGVEITPQVQREVGLAVVPKSKVNINEGTITRGNGQVLSINSPELTSEEQDAVKAAMGVKFPTTTRSGGTTTDELGNTRTTSTATKTPGNVKTAAPPAPPSSSKPAAASAGGSKLDYQINQGVVKDAIKASADARKQVNLLDTAADYMTAVNSGKVKPDSAKDLALIVQAVRAMNPGTVRLPVQEIQLELKRGTYGQQFQRWYQAKLETGTLPKQYRDELFSVIRDETETVAKDAAQNWQQSMRGKPLPPHLKRFAGEAPTAAPSGGPKPAYQKNGVWYDATTHQPIKGE